VPRHPTTVSARRAYSTSNVQTTKLTRELWRGILVLATLSQHQEAKYGYALISSLAERGLGIEQGTLYPILVFECAYPANAAGPTAETPLTLPRVSAPRAGGGPSSQARVWLASRKCTADPRPAWRTEHKQFVTRVGGSME
jgi:hypothetical protein